MLKCLFVINGNGVECIIVINGNDVKGWIVINVFVKKLIRLVYIFFFYIN